MGNLLYIVGIFFIIGWMIGVFGYNAGGPFHLLLILAFIAILISLFQKKNVH
ncbi:MULTISPECIES: lmo0937 family membrane protein [Niastella]|uniref:Lmo0937 family membrane protein n=1 Tax=Niastella soli TaxID=2821487 RepID=A0ABS3YXK0_9BACT|nr:lmo0937 family membrane protein [Niastella soli]MBO9201881.1 lmo0937 family membrane protein [Niastella soli]